MSRLLAPVLLAATALLAQSPRVNYSETLGIPGASAAAIDSAGNLYVVAGSTLLKIDPNGSILSTSTPVPAATLTAVAVDVQDRPVVGGNNFVARPPDFVTPLTRPVFQVAVDRNGNIFAATGSPDTYLVKLSADGSIAWTQSVGGASSSMPSDLVVDAAGSLYLALVTTSAELPASGFEPLLNGVAGAVSYDGGNYFYPVYGVTAPINQWLLTDPNTMYVATQGQGVSLSTDRGQTFTTRNQGLASLTVTMLAADPTSALTLYAATEQGLAKTTNGGTSWTTLPLPTSPVRAIAVVPKNHAQLYAATVTPDGCQFYRSTDSGATWQLQQAVGGATLCVTAFLTDPNDASGVYAVSPAGVYLLGTPAWTPFSSLPGLTQVVADPTTFATWYGLASGGIYKSADKGATWNLVQPGAYSALAAGIPYLAAGTTSGTLVTSLTKGAAWIPVPTAPFAQPVRTLLSDSGTLFAGAAFNPGIWLAKFSPADGSLLQSTFLGGTGSETAARLAVDAQGVTTVAFESDSGDAPTTLDAAQRRPGGGTDIVITRLTPAFGLQYASYFGGSGDEHIGGVKLDSLGFLYVAGTTQSADLPISANALQPVPVGGSDAFAAVFNPSANGLVYGAYFGTADDDHGITLIPDTKGNSTLIGTTPTDTFILSLAALIGYQPVNPIRNAASLVTGPVAPGSLVTIDGSYGALSGISVMFNGQPATIVQARDDSIDVAVPDGLPSGNATISIQSRNGLAQGAARIVQVTPGLFSANRDGQGVALATLVRVYADGTQENEDVFACAATCTALPIDFGDDSDTLFLQITATGLRNETDLSQFQVTVGGQPATVIGAGPQGISPGLDQLIIQLPRPADGFLGPAVWNIQVTVDGQTSNAVSIAVG